MGLTNFQINSTFSVRCGRVSRVQSPVLVGILAYLSTQQTSWLVTYIQPPGPLHSFPGQQPGRAGPGIPDDEGQPQGCQEPSGQQGLKVQERPETSLCYFYAY